MCGVSLSCSLFDHVSSHTLMQMSNDSFQLLRVEPTLVLIEMVRRGKVKIASRRRLHRRILVTIAYECAIVTDQNTTSDFGEDMLAALATIVWQPRVDVAQQRIAAWRLDKTKVNPVSGHLYLPTCRYCGLARRALQLADCKQSYHSICHRDQTEPSRYTVLYYALQFAPL